MCRCRLSEREFHGTLCISTTSFLLTERSPISISFSSKWAVFLTRKQNDDGNRERSARRNARCNAARRNETGWREEGSLDESRPVLSKHVDSLGAFLRFLPAQNTRNLVTVYPEGFSARLLPRVDFHDLCGYREKTIEKI